MRISDWSSDVCSSDLASDAKRSLSMYMAEFSVKKVTAEVERQNLEDTLSLNKTLSDIQNQLLALPAAILLAGATIKRSEEHTSELQSLMRISYAVFCLKKKKNNRTNTHQNTTK